MKQYYNLFRKYIVVLGAVWTCLVIASLWWSIHLAKETMLENAYHEATIAFNKDILYRKWATKHGGLYVPATEETPPNPYLSHMLERDIITPAGRQLTLINPAYMNRQVYEIEMKEYEIRGHLTSLKPIRPDNAPDPWEKKALETLVSGNKEVTSLEIMEGKEYFRLMRPFITEKDCLRCHAVHGFKEGEMRGGISVSIPMNYLRKATNAHVRTFVITHAGLWIIGLVGLVAGSRRLRQSEEERSRTEETICAEKDKLQKYLDVAGVMFIVIDANAKVSMVNKRACMILGYDEEDIIGKNWFDMFLPERVRDKMRGVFRSILSGKVTPYEYVENEVLTKNGDERLIAWHNTYLVDEKGAIINTLSSGEDITNRKAVEKQLKLSEEQYRNLFEDSSDAIFVSTPEGRFLDINRAGIELFGYDSKKEILKVDIGRELYIYPEDRNKFNSIFEGQGFVKDYELLMRRKDGEIITILETATAVRDSTGKIIAYRGIIRDITLQKKLEQQLIHAQKLEVVGQLAGGIAHEFNNILTAIVGYSNIMLIKLDKESPLRTYADQILLSVDRAAALTKGLLTFSRQHVLNPWPVSVNEMIKRIEVLLLKTLGEGIEVRMKLSDDDIVVLADSGQIEHVMINLATNARDAMPKGGELIIETEVADIDEGFVKTYGYGEMGKYCRISFSDTGIGMDEMTKKRIFEPFFTTKQVGKGTGLGLSITYGIIKQHKGFITVDSEPGKGSTFWIYLPLASSQVKTGQTAEMAHKTGGDETILFVEDEEAIRRPSVSTLREFGYRVLDASDGEEGISVFETHKDEIDLVIIDVMLPKKSGRTVFDEIRKVKPEVKVLFMSGFPTDVVQQEGIVIEEGNFLFKPVSPTRLLKKVKDVLEK